LEPGPFEKQSREIKESKPRNYLRSTGLPTWDINEAKRLAENVKASADRLEGYLAAPGYKALAQGQTRAWYRRAPHVFFAPG
jgi:hypothetical protein